MLNASLLGSHALCVEFPDWGVNKVAVKENIVPIADAKTPGELTIFAFAAAGSYTI